MKHFIDLVDLSANDIRTVLNKAAELKKEWQAGGNKPVLKGKVLAMVFQKPSLRTAVFPPYQINDDLIAHAKADAIVMHCLPAHRGEEITDSAADGPQSVLFPQAANRLHAQKGILALLMGE